MKLDTARVFERIFEVYRDQAAPILTAALIVAAVMFFLVIKPVNVLMARYATEHDVESPTHPCPECLSQIPRAATRCSFCTTEVAPAPA